MKPGRDDERREKYLKEMGIDSYNPSNKNTGGTNGGQQLESRRWRRVEG